MPAGFGDRFRWVVVVLRRHCAWLALVSLVYNLIATVVHLADNPLSRLVPFPGGSAPFPRVLAYHAMQWLITATAMPILAFTFAFLIVVLVRAEAGQPVLPGDAIRLASRRFLPLAGWLMLGVAVLTLPFSVRITVVSIVLFWCLFTVFGSTLLGVAVIERRGLSRCLALIQGRFWSTAGRMSVIFLFGACYWLLAVFGLGLLGDTSASWWVIREIIAVILFSPMHAVVAVVGFVGYLELRSRADGAVTAEALTAEVGETQRRLH